MLSSQTNHQNMQVRHNDRRMYFDELAQTCQEFFIPYILQFKKIDASSRILEIGCGDGGNLLPFSQMGCYTLGVDMAEGRIADARRFFKEYQVEGEFIAPDVFLLTDLHHSFDIILCHDVIEHIGDKNGFLSMIPDFLAPDGVLFMSFPAWQMPFGGHQQICRSKLMSHLPFVHLLPTSLYRGLLHLCGEKEDCINELMSIKKTRTPIELFEKTVADTPFIIKDRELYFINPHYKTKFGLQPRKLAEWIGKIPYLRNFFTTSCFYLLVRQQ